MRRSGVLSIGKAITLALLLTLAFVVVVGTVVFDRLSANQRRATNRAGALALAEILATQFHPDASIPGGELQRACDRFAEHPNVTAVAIWDQSGSLSAAAVIDPQGLALLRTPPPDTLTGPTVRPAPRIMADTDDLLRVDVPLGSHFRPDRPARLTVFVRTGDADARRLAQLGRYLLPVVSAAILAILVTGLWFQRRVIGPIGALLTAVRTGKVGDARVAPTARRDELGVIARTVLDLYGKAHQYQERAHRIERSLDSRVADETRRIQLDMKKIEREAWRDPLTGVQNRRMLEDRFTAIFEAQRRAGGDLSVVMIDIDHFKTLNDTLGHQAGDELLTFTGELIRQCLRSEDTAIRYGGDEFLLILPGASVEQAQSIAGRIIALFAQRAKVLNVSPTPSMSAGVASQLLNEPTTPKEIIDLADQALYEAKQAGRNRLRICRNIEALAPAQS
ncbi:MAG: diguanylate cyclase [Phycisphaerae bacterium]